MKTITQIRLDNERKKQIDNSNDKIFLAIIIAFVGALFICLIIENFPV